MERVVVGRSPAMESLEDVGVTRDGLAQTASRLLDRTRGFVAVRRAGKEAVRFLAQVDVQGAEVRAAGPAAGPAAHVVVGVSLEPTNGAPALHEVGRGFAPVGDGPAALRRALERATTAALESAVEAFSAQLAAEHEPKSELVRDLASPNPSVRDRAMRILADRGERDAVPALMAQLRDPDAEVREHAVGALAQLRDARAVPALIELVRHRDPRYVAQMARIVGDIGGTDARAWLLTMAFGHPDQAVRSSAHEALADMTARDMHASVEQGER